METHINDTELCIRLTTLLENLFSNLTLTGGANEPYYRASKEDSKAIIYYRDNYPRSLLHEVAHYCLAGRERRKLDDYGYWYNECGRTEEQQRQFELVEARPQGLEKAFCQAIGIDFTPSLDDFSGNPPSETFLQRLEDAYQEMLTSPPPTAKKVLKALADFKKGEL